MSDLILAKRYAKALYSSAEEANAAEQIGEQLKAVVDLFAQAQEQDPMVRSFLSHPSVTNEAKMDVIKQVFGDSLSELLYNTLGLLIERGRWSLLPALYQAYEEIADEKAGRARALVYSAYELSEADSQAIAAQFSKITGKQILVQNIVDRSLIGGIRVRIGDRLYDGSIAGRLEQLRKQLKQNA